MSYIKNWYVSNQDAITWFVIGFLTMAMFNSIALGTYGWAVISAFLIWTNYKLRNVRL
jgi:uncharacterized membrane protein YadS